MPPQRLPIVNSDDGVWGDILRQYLAKEHYNDDTNNAANGGHKNITVRAGTTTAAPITLSSGSLLTTPAIGSIEFNNDTLYFTQTTSTTRKKIAMYDDASGATGDTYYRDSSGYFTRLGIGSTNNVLTVAGGIPSWSSTLTNATLTDPKVNTLKDTAGNTQFTTSPTDMSASVDLNMQGNYVWNLHDPVDPLDAATKEYVDTSVAGLPRNDANLVIGGDFQTDAQWVNAWGSQTSDQAVYTGGKSHQIVSTGAGSATDYISLTHDGTGTPTQMPAMGERRYVLQVWLRKKNTNTGGGNIALQTFRTLFDNTTASITSNIASTEVDSASWLQFEYTHTVSVSNDRYHQFRIGLDSSVPAGDTFYVGAVLISDLTGGFTAYTSDTLTNKTVNDTTFTIQNTTDNTKTVKFSLSGLATGAAVTLNAPNVSAGSHTLISRNSTDTMLNKTLGNPTINNYTEGVVTIGTVTSAHTLDLTNGTVQTATLTASTACTFTMPTATAGKSFVLMLKQAASTGNGTATFTSVKWNSGGAPTITATAGKMDILTFFSDGTNWYGSYTQGYTP